MQVPPRDEGRNRLEGKCDAQTQQRLPQDGSTGLMSAVHLITLTKEPASPITMEEESLRRVQLYDGGDIKAVWMRSREQIY